MRIDRWSLFMAICVSIIGAATFICALAIAGK